MTEIKTTKIPRRQKCVDKDHPYIGGSVDVIDDALGKPQSQVNQERISEEANLDSKIATEKTRAEGVEGSLNTRLQTVEQLAEISVGGGDIGIGTAADFESDDPSDLAKVPTIGAMLGGANDGVYDISARHNGTKYADLAAALGTNGINVPVGVRKGGMSVKYVQSSDNNYVQARCMAQNFTTDVTQWQGVDAEPVNQSKNLLESGGAAHINKDICYKGWLSSEGVDAYGEGRYEYIVPVSSTDTITIRTKEQNISFYAFLKDFSQDKSGVVRNYSLCNGESREVIQSNTEVTVTVPNDAKFILISGLSIDGDYTPASATVSTKSIVFINAYSQINDLANIINNEIKKTTIIEKDVEKILENNVVSKKVKGWINSDGTIYQEDGRYIYVIPVISNDILEITSKTNYVCYYLFIQSYSLGSNGFINSIDICANQSRTVIPVGNTVTISAPSDAHYVILSSTSIDGDYTPQKLVINGNNIGFKCFQNQINDLEAGSFRTVAYYGAKGDGVTDDTTSLQTALDVGGYILFENKTYKITSPLIIKSNSVVNLNNATLKQANPSARCVIKTYNTQNDTDYNGPQNILIHNGTLDANGSVTSECSCLAMAHGDNITIRNVVFKGVGAGMHSIDMAGCRNVLFDNCLFKDMLTSDSWGECIQIDGVNSPTSYPYVSFSSSSAFFDDCGCENIEIRGCEFYLNNYSPAIGNHNYSSHKRIDIHDNIIVGTGSSNANRGAIVFDIYSGYTGQNNHTDLVFVHHNFIDNCYYGFVWDANSTTKAFVRDNILINVTDKEKDSPGSVVYLNDVEISS